MQAKFALSRCGRFWQTLPNWISPSNPI